MPAPVLVHSPTTGVDGLMASVGLTGGAFYSHF